MNVIIKAKKDYADIQLEKLIRAGGLCIVDEERAKEIIEAGYADIFDIQNEPPQVLRWGRIIL